MDAGGARQVGEAERPPELIVNALCHSLEPRRSGAVHANTWVPHEVGEHGEDDAIHHHEQRQVVK